MRYFKSKGFDGGPSADKPRGSISGILSETRRPLGFCVSVGCHIRPVLSAWHENPRRFASDVNIYINRVVCSLKKTLMATANECLVLLFAGVVGEVFFFKLNRNPHICYHFVGKVHDLKSQSVDRLQCGHVQVKSLSSSDGISDFRNFF